MMKLMDLIKEEEKRLNRKFDYGCVMIYFNFQEMFRIHNKINPDDVYVDNEDESFGLEDEPHVTLLFGLHDNVTTDDVVKVLDKFTFYTCTAHNPSLFSNENYDVLKYDITGDNIMEANKELTKFPYTTNFPDYHPHMTVAYLKKGKGKKYADMLKKYGDFQIAPVYAVYSQVDGTRDKISIKID